MQANDTHCPVHDVELVETTISDDVEDDNGVPLGWYNAMACTVPGCEWHLPEWWVSYGGSQAISISGYLPFTDLE